MNDERMNDQPNYHPKASTDTNPGEGAAKQSGEATSSLCEVGIGGSDPLTTNEARPHNALVQPASVEEIVATYGWSSDDVSSTLRDRPIAASTIASKHNSDLTRACEKAHTMGWDAAMRSCGNQIQELRAQIESLANDWNHWPVTRLEMGGDLLTALPEENDKPASGAASKPDEAMK